MAALGFKYAITKEAGRLPHNPANMLMLYLYGYLNRIRSSRRLEAEDRQKVTGYLITRIRTTNESVEIEWKI